MRASTLRVQLHLGHTAAELQQLERVLDSFEAYCTVTASIAAAIPVQAQVFDAQGQRLK